MFDFRRTFHPTPEEQEAARLKYIEVCRENIERKACCTCVHHISVPGYHPGFVIGADEDCDTGRCPIKTCEEYELDMAKMRLELLDKMRFS